MLGGASAPGAPGERAAPRGAPYARARAARRARDGARAHPAASVPSPASARTHARTRRTTTDARPPPPRDRATARRRCTRSGSLASAGSSCASLSGAADAERLLQMAARTRQSRHHGTDRRAGDARDLLVRQILDLTQHDHLPELGLEPVERQVQLLAIGFRECARVGRVLTAARRAVLLVDVLHALPAGTRRAPPGIAAVAHDGEQPWSRVAPAERAVVAPRPQVHLLDDVLRVMLVAHEMARERVRVVEQRHDRALERLQRAIRHARLDPG